MEGMFIAAVVGLLGNFAVVAMLVMVAVRMIDGFWPSFTRALLCSTLILVLSLIVAATTQSILGHGNGASLTALIMFAVNTVLLKGLIRRPDGTPIGLGTAALASLIQMTSEIVLVLLLALVLGVSLVAAMQGAH
jgi:hypothetical protein